MKNKLPEGIFFICFISLLFCSNVSSQVSGTAWHPIHLVVSGANTLNGVSAFFQLSKCNGEDVVFIKFINHNKHAVKLKWHDAVFTQEKKWINNDDSSEKKSLSISPVSEVAGDCSGKNELVVVKLKNFISTADMFKLYGVSNLLIASE